MLQQKPTNLIDDRGSPPHPAILYQHSHWSDYAVGLDELFQPWPVRETPAVALARRGFAVMSIDAYAFGQRRGGGPGGPAERGRDEETSLSKLFLWQGTSLWAMMLRDDLIALDYLAARPEIHRRRIGATGMSMGSTRTWWLAALDERIAAAVCVACLTRYQALVRHRALARHGIYYFVPGMLRHFDSEAVLGLIAPRPLLTLTGGRDPGSPIDGVRYLNHFCRRLWALHGRRDHFAARVYPRLAHVYTREMWGRTVAWLVRHLRPEELRNQLDPAMSLGHRLTLQVNLYPELLHPRPGALHREEHQWFRDVRGLPLPAEVPRDPSSPAFQYRNPYHSSLLFRPVALLEAACPCQSWDLGCSPTAISGAWPASNPLPLPPARLF